MIKTIILKELKELQRDTRFKIASVIVVLLLIIAGITSFRQFKATTSQYKASKEKEREMWDNQAEKNPHSAAHDGTYVFKPKNVLSLLDSGINSYVGNAVLLEAHYRNKASYSEAYDETEFSRNNKLTLNFVLLYLFPLIILLIGFNIITKEKELDTLRLLKSQGVKPLQLVLGKWFAVFTVIFLMCLVVFVILGIALAVVDANTFDGVHLLLIFVSYMVYYTVIISVVVLVSTLSKNSGIALVSSLAIWVVFCFIMPKIATNVANQLYPYPTKQEFKAAIDEDKENGFNAHDPNNAKGNKFKAELLKKHNVKSLEELDFNYNGLLMQKSEEEASEIYAKHYGNLNQIFENQNKAYRSLAFLSPFIPTRLFSMDLTHTGYNADKVFSEETDHYRLTVQKFLNDDLKNNSKQDDWSYKMKAEQFKKLPKFEFDYPTTAVVLEWNLKNIVILLCWFMLPLVVIARASKKL